MIFTDEARVYRNLPKMGYEHERVYHSANIYVEGEAHTNSVESFWSIAKNGIRGSNRHVGSRYLQGYLNAYAFRWNLGAMALRCSARLFRVCFFSSDSH